MPDESDAMRLFRKAPGLEPGRHRLQHRVPHPWDPPEKEFPGIVPIGSLLFGRSEHGAIAITGISVYTSGFEIFVTRLIRPGTPGIDDEPVPGTPRDRLAARESFQISLQLADGRKVTSGRPHGDSAPAGPILRPRGGGGTSHYQLLKWWAWPLPPSGPLEFICRSEPAKHGSASTRN
ncbi:MAG: hypothetical protein ACR2MP_34445 [Streptosporangiaceae bacterium]